MVKVPSTIHDLACQQARQWIQKNVYAGHENDDTYVVSAETFRGLTAAINSSSAVLPIDDLTNLFADCGYGVTKANGWINSWIDRGKISLVSYQGKPEFVKMLSVPLDVVDEKEILIRIEEYRARQQRRIDAVEQLRRASA